MQVPCSSSVTHLFETWVIPDPRSARNESCCSSLRLRFEGTKTNKRGSVVGNFWWIKSQFSPSTVIEQWKIQKCIFNQAELLIQILLNRNTAIFKMCDRISGGAFRCKKKTSQQMSHNHDANFSGYKSCQSKIDHPDQMWIISQSVSQNNHTSPGLYIVCVLWPVDQNPTMLRSQGRETGANPLLLWESGRSERLWNWLKWLIDHHCRLVFC